MVINFNRLSDKVTATTYLCIVGSGIAGLLIARQFIGTPWIVVLLESGGQMSEEEAQALSCGEISGTGFRGLQAGRRRVFGSSTTLWSGQCIALDDIDFAERRWVPFSSWPFGRVALAPYYEDAKRHLGVGKDVYDQPTCELFGLAPLRRRAQVWPSRALS